MTTLFDELHDSHAMQRSLCRQLTRAGEDAARRESVFLQLQVELKAHAAAEERFLYVPLLMTDGGLMSSRHALSEHHEIEELCEKLSVKDKSGAAWMTQARKLSEEVHHHLKEEEKKFFKVAGRILSDAQKKTLARRYAKDVVRMRKHYAEAFQTVVVDAEGSVKARKPRSAARKSAPAGASVTA